MDKRKNRALAATFMVIVLMAAVSVFMFNFTGNFKLKDGKVIAGEISADKIFSPHREFKRTAKNTAEYLSRQGINTAVFKTDSYSDTTSEIVKELKPALSRKKIQLFLSLKADGLSDENIISATEYLCENYVFAGLVLENPDGTNVVEKLSEILKDGKRDIKLYISTSNSEKIEKIDKKSVADGFIAKKMGSADYDKLKSKINSDLLLHYSSRTMARDVFLLTNLTSCDGAVITDFDGNDTQPLLLQAAFDKNENLPVFDLQVSTDFHITYPTKDFTTYYKGLYITGTGRPGGTVKINGEEYKAEKDGTFGVYYELEKGENQITIGQNGVSKTFEITKKTYKNTGVTYELPWDDSKEASPGQIVHTTSVLTSILSDPDDDSAIIAGAEQGTKLKVVSSVETKRNSKKTYAYKLSNGGYVLANKVEYTEDDFSPVISKISVKKRNKTDEILSIKVNDSPLVLSDFGEESLTLHFLDTAVEAIKIPQSDFFTGCEIKEKSDGAYLEFTYSPDKKLWGYDIAKTEDGFEIYLKHAPKLALGEKPLQGVRIVLDPGHGGKDSGALGVAAQYGPYEKDINLAVATATKELLQQWGAEVVMTREDDTFPSLDDRRNLTRSVKADLFIAIHHNSMDYSYNSANSLGSECYYFTHQSENLARLLCENVTNTTGRQNRGADTGYYYVTRVDICPAALMEYSFIINPKDFSKTYTNTDIYKAAFGTLQAALKAIPQ